MLLNVPNSSAAVPTQNAIHLGEAVADEFDATILLAEQDVEYFAVKNKDAAHSLRAFERMIQTRVVGEP